MNLLLKQAQYINQIKTYILFIDRAAIGSRCGPDGVDSSELSDTCGRGLLQYLNRRPLASFF